jgi:predicted acylesterase/phospholipase RssA
MQQGHYTPGEAGICVQLQPAKTQRMRVKTRAWQRLNALCCALAIAFSLSGCSRMYTGTTAPPMSPAIARVERNGPNQPLAPGRERPEVALVPRHKGSPLVLLTISGGGSRSAYYAARVMEELSQVPSPSGEGSILDDVRVISTVSAGGLASSWYAVHYSQRHDPDFFLRFKNAMGVNLQWRTYGHMAMFPPLALELLASGLTRTDLLANEIENLVADGKPISFDDLWRAENDPVDPCPKLIFNGTVYNSGQRLAMTNIPPARFPSLLEGKSSTMAVSPRDEGIISRLVQPLTFEDIGSDIGQFRIAQAVAASAAYPIILAPFRLQVFAGAVPERSRGRASADLLASEYIHIADGGLYENEGVDALLSLIKSLPRSQPVLMLVVDASQRMETVKANKHRIWDPITVISRMYDIGTMRPLAFYGSMAKEFHDADKLEGVVIRMEGYDPQTEARLQDIPTMFKLGEKHRAALDRAADENVEHMKQRLLDCYQQLSHKSSRRTHSKVAAK